MLSYFEVFTTSGIVLFSQDLSSNGRHTSLINSFVKDVFIEGTGSHGPTDGAAATNPPYRQEKHVLRWTLAKDLGLVFVAVYQSLIQLEWVNKLLDNLKVIFCELYQDEVRNPYVSTVECSGFKAYFDQQRRELEGADQPVSLETSVVELTPPSSSGEEAPPPNPGLLKAPTPRSLPTPLEETSATTSDASRPVTPNSSVLVGSGGPKGSRRAKKAARAVLNPSSSTPASSGDESRRRLKTGKVVKKGRRWDADGLADEEDDVQLDYSAPGEAGAVRAVEAVDASKIGVRTKDGFLLNDMDVDDEVHSILRDASAKTRGGTSSAGIVGSSLGKISGLFRSVVGGKVLTKEDLDTPIRNFEKHLIEKNVAREVAIQICEGVENDMIGQKTGNFESVDAFLRASVKSTLQRLLTPTTSLDLLRSIESATTANSNKKGRAVWVGAFLGVNGVGKSSSLAKIAFWILQQPGRRVLVAAADTYRSGAVEQLRVHVRNLSELCKRENTGHIELFERGYGQDAAVVAKQAVQYAGANNFDCVLVDTAGRQSNSHLMGSLEKFVQLVDPDAIWLVAEAVVGSDSVNQARKFNDSLGRGRDIDGYIISKCDVVDDMIGTIVNMVVTTSTPAVFLGVGQHYGDLRTFSVNWVTNLLMS